MQERIVFHPLDEIPPASIMNGFGKFAVFDHISDLKVFIGNQVARRDERVCLFSGKILTLPLNFQMLRGQSFSGFLPIGRFLLFLREPSLETFESLFSFAVVPRIGDGVPIRIS